MTTLEEEAAARRAALVDQLLANGHACQPGVADAFRKEPRHVYAPRLPASWGASWQTKNVLSIDVAPGLVYRIRITPDNAHTVVAEWAGHTWLITPPEPR